MNIIQMLHNGREIREKDEERLSEYENQAAALRAPLSPEA